MVLKHTTFGGYKIEYKGVTLTTKDFKSDMLMKLMGIFITHRDAPLDSDLMCSELWAEGEISNPAGALKNLAYRLRQFLKEYFDDDFIISTRGSYSWNPEIECEVDCEIFEHYANDAKYELNPVKKVELLTKAIELYTGEFNPDIQDVRCINVLKAYYHGIYVTASKALCDELFNQKRYLELNDMCGKILAVDSLEEKIYYYLIMSCVMTNDLQMGMEIYEKASRLLKKELGVNSLPQLEEAYESLLGLSQGDDKRSFFDLRASLNADREPGPFVCGYTIFKEIYQLLIRQRIQGYYSGVLLLYTFDFDFDLSAGKVEKFKADKIKKAFFGVLKNRLRMGDVISRYSEYQYVVLLNGCDVDSVHVVTDRIHNSFVEYYPQYSGVKIRCQQEKIEPIVR